MEPIILRTYALIYVFFGLALSSTLARLYTRGRLLRHFGLDDVLILAAACIEIPVMAIIHMDIGLANSMLDHIRNGNALSAEGMPVPAYAMLLSKALRLQYFHQIYWLEVGLIKLSLLAFYLRLLTGKRNRLMLQALGFIIAGFSVALFLAACFRCNPVSNAWNLATFQRCHIEEPILHLVSAVFNLATDLVILVLPVRTVLGLQLNFGKKFGLIFIFSFGIVSTVATVMRLVFASRNMYPRDTDLRHLPVLICDVALWSRIEPSAGILCANLPTLTALWRKLRTKSPSTHTSSGRNTYFRGSKSEAGGVIRAGRPRRRSNDFELGRLEKGSTINPSGWKSLNSSQEHMVEGSHEDKILRTTQLDISIDPRDPDDDAMPTQAGAGLPLEARHGDGRSRMVAIGTGI